MIPALYYKFPFILDGNLAKANCTENQVCTSCDIVVLGKNQSFPVSTVDPHWVLTPSLVDTGTRFTTGWSVAGQTHLGDSSVFALNNKTVQRMMFDIECRRM